ncbi:UDP-glucose 4-epimerase family protein [Vibrio sonorensis]|uniref:UDP-glucose 4-epimerase family protein n=1 Tax=Vibrio sonorensis TaxID=1004316 RepID=UPI0008D9C909|nr:SDR family oxidoreductase [Vibrio sonorensis]
MQILVTGCNGFVGSRLTVVAKQRGYCLTKAQRNSGSVVDESVFSISSIDKNTNWKPALVDIDCVVHCAARVHQMGEEREDSLSLYREVNTEGSLNLARQAAEMGVKRFVFISSIKVNGEFSDSGRPFTSEDVSTTDDPYGLSKYEAEQGLQIIAQGTGLEVVIIRPPLVYGPNVKANFLTMMKWVEKGIPLPLGSIDNRRSLLFLDNLIDFILTTSKHPAAVGKTFLLSDGEDVSTASLIQEIAKVMGKRAHLFPIPVKLIQWGANLLGKPKVAQRICSNLQIDSSEARETLGWVPPFTLQEGIRATVEHYLSNK